jgi:dihydroorotate dehydrogenase
MYKRIIRPLLFSFDAETVHHFVFALLKFSSKIPGFKTLLTSTFTFRDAALEKEIFGLKFTNPVGLAAGFDKDARLIDELACLGFGFVEIGTLTPRPQAGNEKPRLFRLPDDQALVNRMGFNNQGMNAAVQHLKKRSSRVIVGGNIGKNKTTRNEDAIDDYAAAFEALYNYVDYFVLNISSPNTPGLRELQDKEPLRKLLVHIKRLSLSKPAYKPILLKIAPDLIQTQLDDIIQIVKETNIDGVVATNTTVSRDGLKTGSQEVASIGNGGVSGKPLTRRSTEVIRYLRQQLGATFPIIGVGGIMTPNDAIEKLDAGADLIQLYTGFIYEGPGLIKQINKLIVKSKR